MFDRTKCRAQVRRRARVATVSATVVLLAALSLPSCENLPVGDDETPSADPPQRESPRAPSAVSSLGRIEPKDGTTRVTAPYFDGRPSIVEDLRVGEGEWVKESQILAVLKRRSNYQARLQEAQSRIPVMEARLRKAKEGPKQGDVAAQKSEIARWESMLELARTDLARFRKLRASEDVSASGLDAKRREVENAEKMLAQSRERLTSLIEIRPSDVALAERELESARASVGRARAELDLTIVRSPIRAQVLEVHAREGEEIGPTGLLELGKTDEMYVIAEVYETDVSRVHVEGRATISGDILDTAIEGTVARIEQQVEKNQVLPLDPTEFSDARIIKVHVRLDDSEPVANLIYGRVSVRFHP